MGINRINKRQMLRNNNFHFGSGFPQFGSGSIFFNEGLPLRIALIANLKEKFTKGLSDPPDAGAEFDQRATIDAIISALESRNHSVIFLEADKNLPSELARLMPDICFNIAEGYRGAGREAQVPALCELMEIPYTGSGVVTNAISLDKTKTKQIWQNLHLPVAPYQEIRSMNEIKEIYLRFPLIVKPVREGTGMGIDNNSLVFSKSALTSRVEWVLQTYHEPALVEEYLPGREFTVGYIGNAGDSSHRYRSDLYDSEGYHWLPILEINSSVSITPGLYGHEAKEKYIAEQGAPNYLCPADISEKLKGELIDLAKRAAQAIDALDVSRVDFRLGAEGEPYLMEINTLPGLNPQVSDLCIMAQSEDMEFETLINEILSLALERYGLNFNNRMFKFSKTAELSKIGMMK